MQLAKRDFIKLLAAVVFLPRIVKLIPQTVSRVTKAAPGKRAPGGEKTVNWDKIQKRGDWLG
ncbi:MAG: hypothetical protein GY750_09165 [Lentisphaerae bacterium]|nr:hypothetical protein [Lentisphaerota bacterium]MCP4101581.1 hypothetical protein [Lentisphaerota bacterium]